MLVFLGDDPGSVPPRRLLGIALLPGAHFHECFGDKHLCTEGFCHLWKWISNMDVRANDTRHQGTCSVIMGLVSLKSTGPASGLETQAGLLSKMN